MVMTTSSTLPPKGGWTTGTQVQEQRKTSSGTYVNGMTVHFVTGYGVSSTIWLPNATYTPSNVKAAIKAKVAILDQVSRLQTTGPK